MLLIYVYESILRPCISTLYYTPILQVVSKVLLRKMNQLIAENLPKIWFFEVFSDCFFNFRMSLVALNYIHNRNIHWFFYSQIEEITHQMGLYMPNYGVTMAHSLMMSFSVCTRLLLRSRPKKSLRGRFEAALRFLKRRMVQWQKLT